MAFVTIKGKTFDEHDIFNDGYDAAENGVAESENPYNEKGTREERYAADVWNDG